MKNIEYSELDRIAYNLYYSNFVDNYDVIVSNMEKFISNKDSKKYWYDGAIKVLRKKKLDKICLIDIKNMYNR